MGPWVKAGPLTRFLYSEIKWYAGIQRFYRAREVVSIHIPLRAVVIVTPTDCPAFIYMSITEVWKQINWAAKFEVSNLGRVRRISTKAVRSPWRNSRGYCFTRIRDNNGRFCTYRIHRLVMEAFEGPCPIGHEVNHKNRNKLDNSLANLEYVTPKGNVRHFRETSGLHYGRPRSLTREQAERVLDLQAAGLKRKEIAKDLGVEAYKLQGVLYARTWRELRQQM